jgi:hypothetical protein
LYTAGVTQRQNLAVLLAQAGVILAVLIAATVLCGMDKIDGAAVTAVYGAALGAVGVTTMSLGNAAINGGPKPDLNKLAESSTEASVILAHKQAPSSHAETTGA